MSEYRGVDGLTHIRRAAWALTGPEGYVPPHKDVAEAFGHVWDGLAFADLWPDDLRAQAVALIVAMRRHGPRHVTAFALTDAEAREFADMVQRFVEHADRLELAETVSSLRSRGVVSDASSQFGDVRGSSRTSG